MVVIGATQGGLSASPNDPDDGAANMAEMKMRAGPAVTIRADTP